MWFGRASRYTLRGNRGLCTAVDSFVQQVARYEENRELCIGVESFVQQVARYEEIGELRIGVESFVLLNTKSLFGIMMHRM